jgi:type II secretory pathway predicted ATPase ExeA
MSGRAPWPLRAQVEELGRERIHPVFLLDEAHLLHQDVMDHLHILLNYHWDSRALLSIVLDRKGPRPLRTRIRALQGTTGR